MSLSADLDWFAKFRGSEDYHRFQSRPVAYFCAEFALDARLPIYAGGLGVLAGDVVREAADQEFPLVGVGLYYHGQATASPAELGLQPVLAETGLPLDIRIPLSDHHIHLGAWRWQARRDGQQEGATVYLLTTDVDGNEQGERAIADHLYTKDKERRLQQEMVLGIGGLRLLEALGIHPSIYHLNEGHSALLAVEIAAQEMRERGIGFSESVELARRHIVFTNHTLVSAGQELFSNDMVAANLIHYAEELDIPVSDIVSLGLVQDSSLFSMTMLPLRLAGRINAVSRLHAAKAAEIWTDHPMVGITNGIHLGSWDRATITNDHRQLWDIHQQNKQRLLDKIFDVTGQKWDADTLLLGWARRIVGYKRPLALLADVQRFVRICSQSERPVLLVMSGNPQRGDAEGEQLFRELQQKLSTTPLAQYAVFLPDYTTDVAAVMTAGCDVWLNTPVVGFEACGTSAMKAALNGTIICSTRDGWLGETDTFGLGWTLDSTRVSQDLYEKLEQEIAPMFYDDKQLWETHMSRSRRLILDKFSTTRLLKEYIEKLYLPMNK